MIFYQSHNSGGPYRHDFAMILPNQIHGFRTPQTSACWIGVFSDDYVKEFSKYIGDKQGEMCRFVCSEHILQFVENDLIREEPCQQLLLMKSILYAVCYEYIRQVPLIPRQQTTDVPHRILQYIMDHYRQELTLRDIADSLGYEYHYLSRCFHRMFRLNFKTLLNQYRCEYAKIQLLRPDRTVTDIAYESGFQSIRNFNRIFKDYTGMEPSNYAKNILQTYRQP